MGFWLEAAARACIVCCPLILLVGCGGGSDFQPSVTVAGNYTVSVTNADNGCMLDNWEVGKSSSDIPFVIEQQGPTLNGSLQGFAALAADAALGTNQFDGTATGNDFDLTAHGKIMRTQGSCTYELNAEIAGSISGDAISGTITYAPATTNDPGCASLQCTSTQNFNGTRPPPS